MTISIEVVTRQKDLSNHAPARPTEERAPTVATPSRPEEEGRTARGRRQGRTKPRPPDAGPPPEKLQPSGSHLEDPPQPPAPRAGAGCRQAAARSHFPLRRAKLEAPEASLQTGAAADGVADRTGDHLPEQEGPGLRGGQGVCHGIGPPEMSPRRPRASRPGPGSGGRSFR